MKPDPNVKTLVKILIGTAWLDGKIQTEERTYLRRIATEKGVASDPEIQPLLNELIAVPPSECYVWVRQYLGDRPSSEECQNLIEAISGLIYSDGDVDAEEAKLLNKIQDLDPVTGIPQRPHKLVIRSLQQLYASWIDEKN